MSILLYIFELGLFLSVFLAFYLLALRRQAFFRFNRAALLAGSLACFLLPLVDLGFVLPEGETMPVDMLERVLVAPVVSVSPAASGTGASLTLAEVLLAVYLLGLAVCLIVSLRSFVRMRRVLGAGRRIERDGCAVHLLEEEVPSFSWARHIVMSEKDYGQNPVVFRHELMHVRCRHSVDLGLFSLICIFQWFNPLVYVAMGELKMLHEYEADDNVLKQGIDATQYQLLLVKKAVGDVNFLVANGFNHSNLKNRITMMHNKNRKSWKKLYVLFLLPLLGASSMFVAEADILPVEKAVAVSRPVTEPVTESVADVPEVLQESGMVPPKFQGGGSVEFAKWVMSNVKYPEDAHKSGKEGKVLLSFEIDTDGKVVNVEVVRSADPQLDAEAVRVVSSSPEWTPGRQDGKNVKTKMMLPVVFQLSKGGK